MKIFLKRIFPFLLLLLCLHSCFSKTTPSIDSEPAPIAQPQLDLGSVRFDTVHSDLHPTRSSASNSVPGRPSDSGTHDDPGVPKNEVRIDISGSRPYFSFPCGNKRRKKNCAGIPCKSVGMVCDAEDGSNWLKRFCHRLGQLISWRRWRHDNVGASNNNPPGESQAEEVKRAQEYFDRGISFTRKNSANSIDEVSFNRWGVLKIPKLIVHEETLECLRKQKERLGNGCTEYIELMALLVKEKEDVNLLSQEGIICSVYDADKTATKIQELGRLLNPSSRTVSNHHTCQSLNEFYDNQTKVWLALNKREVKNLIYYPLRLIPFIFYIFVSTVAVIHYFKK